MTPETIAAVHRATAQATELNRLSAEPRGNNGPKFQYDRVVRGWIRVLDLQPGTGTDPIICSLSQQPIRGPEPYEAISYVWGEPRERHTITCNWRVPTILEDNYDFLVPTQVTNNLEITDNLNRLLRHLRLEVQPRRLWIDQICIDQDDVAEKASQIRLMAQIYSGASGVVIWMGDQATTAAAALAGHDAEHVFACIDMLAILHSAGPEQRAAFFQWLFGQPTSEEDLPFPMQMLGSVGGPSIGIDGGSLRRRFLALELRQVPHPTNPESRGLGVHINGARHLNHFLETVPWFRRAWTFQESVLGQEATVVYGHFSRGWDMLCQACEMLTSVTTVYNSNWDRLPARSVAESVVRRGRFRQDWALLQALAAPMPPPSTPEFAQRVEVSAKFDHMEFLKRARLKSMLPELRITQATKPMDKVLALVGFAHDDGQKVVFPNTEDLLDVLYLTVVKYWIITAEETAYLRSMGFRHGREDPLFWDEWPSPLVVPEPELSFLSHVGETNKPALPSWVPDWEFPMEVTPFLHLDGLCAAGGWKESASIKGLATDCRLELKGVFVGTITNVESDMTNFDSHADILNSFADPYPTTSMTYLDVYKVIAGPDASALAAKPVRSLESDGFNSGTQPPESEGGKARACRYTGRILQESANLLGQKRAAQQIQQPFQAGRSFLGLDSGLLGLGPRKMERGDVVHVIAGTTVPFVMRRVPGGLCKFVGECFVFGIMHGEAVGSFPDGKIEEIVLA